MSSNNFKNSLETDKQIIKALYALKNKDFQSINAAARFFKVLLTILYYKYNEDITYTISKKIT